jgi:hypothetical protein
MQGNGKETVTSSLDQAVSMVIVRMNDWMESVNKLTTKAETEMLDCLRKCIRRKKINNEELGVLGTTNWSASRNDSGYGVVTPVSNKVPVYINLESPEDEGYRCRGCDHANDDSEEYSISPDICAPQIIHDASTSKKGDPVVAYEGDVAGLDYHDCGYERVRRNCSYDALTNSEDNHLRFGLSGIFIRSIKLLFKHKTKKLTMTY